ncbi:MAG TPA: M1 family metallopeptidase [Steroidobacteraceae bacterium]|nr:M1 family metallopeptidase [Steroidobacteraceae bacterium]
MRRRFAVLWLLAWIAPAAAPAAGAPGRIVLPDDVIPSHYDLTITPDAAAATFTAAVRIELTVRRPTRDIRLNAADLTFAGVRLAGAAGAPAISFDSRQQTATLRFAGPVSAGRHELYIRYAGRINQDPTGLFHLDYDSPAGRGRALYTQLENADARRLFPCWDEPDRKATFTLTVVAPAADMVVSNMPRARTRSAGAGRRRTTFRTTPPMSTYLLFLAVGDFERVTRRVGKVEIGVVVRRGESAKAAFALDAASEILPYYEDYFGIRYPLPKLDLITGPGASQFFAAMENWGAIFLFDKSGLIDPQLSSQKDRIDVYTDIAHEMAHQWFGDLVTMDWWTDLWLNEGFAEWMQYKAMEHFHPEWEPWILAMSEREVAMNEDSRSGTHPIITPITDVLEANSVFDDITYSKSMVVIRMLEHWVGEDAFRAGIRRYLRAHEYANAVSDDLWRALDRTAPAPISQIAHDFTAQAGVPLVRVSGHSATHLEQGRFTAEGPDAPTVWHVPVVVRTPGGTELQTLVSADSPAELAAVPAADAVVNAGQLGYFRTLHDPALFGALLDRFATLEPIDQLGLLEDTGALGLAGYEPLPDILQLAQRVNSRMRPQVQGAAAAALTAIARLYRDRPEAPAFRAYARPLLAPLLAAVGWDAAHDENANTTLLRGQLLADLSDLDDEQVVSHARELFQASMDTPGGGNADRRQQLLEVVGMHADAAQWGRLHELARSSHDVLEKSLYYTALAQVHDPELARQALELTLTNEVQPTLRPRLIEDVAEYFPEAAFDFAVAHREQVNSWLDPDDRDVYQAQLLATSSDPQALERLKAYVASSVPAAKRLAAEAAEAEVAFNIRVRAERLPAVDAWLESHH